MDDSTFYPVLILLHIYGSHTAYDSVLQTIRSRTAAEVAIQADHFTGENAWSDTMSYHVLPPLAEKYKCDLINIRDPFGLCTIYRIDKDFEIKKGKLELPFQGVPNTKHVLTISNIGKGKLPVTEIRVYKPFLPVN